MTSTSEHVKLLVTEIAAELGTSDLGRSAGSSNPRLVRNRPRTFSGPQTHTPSYGVAITNVAPTNSGCSSAVVATAPRLGQRASASVALPRPGRPSVSAHPTGCRSRCTRRVGRSSGDRGEELLVLVGQTGVEGEDEVGILGGDARGVHLRRRSEHDGWLGPEGLELSAAHGHTAPSCSPNHSVVATGTTRGRAAHPARAARPRRSLRKLLDGGLPVLVGDRDRVGRRIGAGRRRRVRHGGVGRRVHRRRRRRRR